MVVVVSLSLPQMVLESPPYRASERIDEANGTRQAVSMMLKEASLDAEYFVDEANQLLAKWDELKLSTDETADCTRTQGAPPTLASPSPRTPLQPSRLALLTHPANRVIAPPSTAHRRQAEGAVGEAQGNERAS